MLVARCSRQRKQTDDKIFLRNNEFIGKIFGVKPTGKRVELSSIVIYRIDDGRIAERWIAQQGPDVLQQIGASVPITSSIKQPASSDKQQASSNQQQTLRE